MAVIPKTVRELIDILKTYPPHFEVWLQGNTEIYAEATPERFVVEAYPLPESDPAMILLAGITIVGQDDDVPDTSLVPVIVDDSNRWRFPVKHEYKGWTIEKDERGRRLIWITAPDSAISQSAIVYEDGTLAYDFPERLTSYIKKHVRRVAKDWF